MAGLDQAGDLAFLEDALRQVVGVGAELDGCADVEGEIADLVGEGEQTFHSGEGAVLAGGLETSLPQACGPGLEIGQGRGGERLGGEGQEPGHIPRVGAAGMGAGLSGEPEGDQAGIGVGDGRDGGRRDDGELVHGVIIARYVPLSCVQAPRVRYHPPSSVSSWRARVVAFAMIVANHREVR